LTVHGVPGYAAGAAVPTVPQILDGAPPANTPPVRVDLVPGSRWRYSGGGYTIAQLAMSDTLGRPFPDLTRTLLLGPAGMSRSTYEQPLPASRLAEAAAGYRGDGSPVAGKRHVYPEMAAAGLWTTAGDLARSYRDQKSCARHRSLLSPHRGRIVTPFIGEFGLGFPWRRTRSDLRQPQRRGRGLPGLPRGPPRRLGRGGDGNSDGGVSLSRSADSPGGRLEGYLEPLVP
jgi:CubicO group peptidase (beta-lactamase class C family)